MTALRQSIITALGAVDVVQFAKGDGQDTVQPRGPIDLHLIDIASNEIEIFASLKTTHGIEPILSESSAQRMAFGLNTEQTTSTPSDSPMKQFGTSKLSSWQPSYLLKHQSNRPLNHRLVARRFMLA